MGTAGSFPGGKAAGA